MYINNESKVLKSGQSVYIPSNACQRIKNIGKDDLKFLCIVSPPWNEEDEYHLQVMNFIYICHFHDNYLLTYMEVLLDPKLLANTKVTKRFFFLFKVFFSSTVVDFSFLINSFSS